MIKKTIKKAINLPNLIKSKKIISALKDGDYSIQNVPYLCQFASPELAKDILEGKINARDDPNWKVFGFKSREEQEFWAFRICGICCIKMILEFYDIKVPIIKLVNEGVALNGFDFKNDSGWYHESLLQLANKYNFKGYVSKHLNIYDLANQIILKKFVIISVNPNIIRMDKNIVSKKKSGHLVLVTGFRIKNQKIIGFFINNPSGKEKTTQKNAFVPIDIFLNAYGERGIVIYR